MNIFHINTSDSGGGAEEFAFDLCSKQKNATLWVKSKNTSADFVYEIPKPKLNKVFLFLNKVLWKLGIKKTFRMFLGIRDEFHSSYSILKRIPQYQQADIVHLHNLHGEFFNLRDVKKIAKEKAIIWTSHDMWPITGGEAYILSTYSNKENLSVYPLNNPIFDTRNYYLNLKKDLYKNWGHKIRFVAPSNAHFNELKVFAPYMSENIHKIYYGIDTSIFKLSPHKDPSSSNLLIFSSNSIFKNSTFVINALKKAHINVNLYVLGNTIPSMNTFFKHKNLGIIKDRLELASIMQSIDFAIFSSKIETFGLLPAEAAACGVHVLLNADLPVFHEHKDLYGAELYEGEKDLIQKIEYYSRHPEEAQTKGVLAAEKIKTKLNRNETLKEYEDLYRFIVQN